MNPLANRTVGAVDLSGLEVFTVVGIRTEV